MNWRPKNLLWLLYTSSPIKKGWETEKNVVIKSLFMENSLWRYMSVMSKLFNNQRI